MPIASRHLKVLAVSGLASGLALAAGVLLLAQAEAKRPGAGQRGSRQGSFVLRSQTNVVLVDVRVSDRNGSLVADLKQEDFRVFEDGAAQTLTSFSFENVERLAQATAENGPPPTVDLGRLPADVPPAKVLQDHRLIVLFFDQTSMAVDDLMRALKAATEFVQSKTTPADLVAVATYTSSLRVIQNFTNDRTTLLKAIRSIRTGESSSLSEAGAQGEPGTTNAAGEEVVARDTSQAFTPDETEFNIFNTDEKLAAIESLARMMKDVPGRKSVIHFSSGVERTGIENQAQLRASADAANQANVSLYTVDARGLMALAPGGSVSAASPAGTAIYTGQAIFSQGSSLQGGRETLASLAADTGGRTFYDLNDFAPAFDTVQRENSSYYLLGYSPSNTRSDGRFRRIRVEGRRQGYRVEARPGYFAPKDFRQFTREEKELELRQAMELDVPLVDLPIAVETAYFPQSDKKYHVVLAAKIPGSAVSFLRKSASRQTEFDFAWRATDQAGRTAGLLLDTLPVKLTSETYEQVLSGNILYEGGLILAPGKYHLKLVVRENESGRLGTFEQALALPEMENAGLMLSSLVLSNELQEGEGSSKSRGRRGGRRPDETHLEIGSRAILPSVTRVFRTSQTLYLYLESYGANAASGANAKTSGSTAQSLPPSIALAFFRGGAKVGEAGPFPGKVEKTAEGRASYFVQIPLEKFRPGRYFVQANVLDPARDRVAFTRVPLAIVGAPMRPGSSRAGS